jgi:hypothetical protein
VIAEDLSPREQVELRVEMIIHEDVGCQILTMKGEHLAGFILTGVEIMNIEMVGHIEIFLDQFEHDFLAVSRIYPDIHPVVVLKCKSE